MNEIISNNLLNNNCDITILEENHINITEIITEIVTNYKNYNRLELEIYNFLLNKILLNTENTLLNKNNIIISSKRVKDILKNIEFQMMKVNDEKNLQIFDSFVKINQIFVEKSFIFVKKINVKDISKQKKLKIKIRENINSLNKVLYVNHFFYSKEILPLSQNKNKKYFYDMTSKYEKSKNFETLEESFNYLNKLKNNISNDFKLKHKMLEIRKNLNLLKNRYDKEWISSIDLEYKENEISEIGITLKNIKTKKLIVKNYIIEDFLLYKKKYTPFNFGISEVVNLKTALEKIKYYLKFSNIIVGNSINSDIELLQKEGLKFDNKFIFDLNTFNSYFYKDIGNKTHISLEQMSKNLSINAKNFHNAGNDSYYSVRCFYKYINKYIKMDFDKINKNQNNNKSKIEEEITLNSLTKDNYKRKILFFKKQLNNEKIKEYKYLKTYNLKFLELYSISDIGIFFKNEKPINVLNAFEKILNKNFFNINFLNINGLLYLDIHNYIIFLNELKQELNYELDNDINEDIYKTLSLNSLIYNQQESLLSLNFKFRTFNKDNTFSNHKLIFSEENIKLKKIIKEEEIQEHNNFNNSKVQIDTIDTIDTKEKIKNKLKILSNKNVLSGYKYEELIKIIKESINEFSTEQLPIDKYHTILKEIIYRKNKNYKFQKLSLEKMKNERMINVNNVSLIFRIKNSRDILNILEKNFIPNKIKDINLRNKLNFSTLNKGNELYCDLESFIYLVKNACFQLNIDFYSNIKLQRELIKYIENFSILSENLSLEFNNIVIYDNLERTEEIKNINLINNSKNEEMINI
jgi:hypothetical protein